MRSEEISRKKLEALVQERTRELEEAIKKEKQLVDLKNQFVAIASHEFRTPLSTIRFAAEYLHDYLEKIEEAEIRSKLKKIEKQVTHMTALLEDVIMAGRTDLKKILVVKSRIELRNLIDKIIEDVQNSTRNTHRIELNYAVVSREIDTDEKLFRNIFINLLSNAIKYSPGKDSVLLNIVEENGLLMITVSDQGIGILEEDQVKLFEAFQRGSNAASIAGTGLGLSIVKKAVELLKGSIRLQSRLNEGTIVEVQLPVATAETNHHN
jgi:signal transduction histidine kinase